MEVDDVSSSPPSAGGFIFWHPDSTRLSLVDVDHSVGEERGTKVRGRVIRRRILVSSC